MPSISRVKKVLLALAVVLLLGNLMVWSSIYSRKRQLMSRELTVAVLNVGQGDAIFIQAPNGNQVIVDGGPNAKILQELGGLMPWNDKTIDMIVITNPDKDHIAGFVDVLKRYDVDYLLESGTENNSLVNNEVKRLAEVNKVEKILARRGMEIFLDEAAGVKLTILFPDRDVSAEKTNDGSIVMRLTYGETEVMLTGDATSGVERHLLGLENSFSSSTPELGLQSDILKVGHHGSKTSSSYEFVKAVAPKFALISLGKDNKYGHPNEEVLGTLAAFPLEVFRTDQMGTIVMKSDGKQFVREK